MTLENNLFIDFHTHALPKMDDGPKDISTAISMLKETHNKGIYHIILTPHFYADDEYPMDFLKRREESYSLLVSSIEDKSIFPSMMLGAEVAYFKGIGSSASIKDLTILGTNYILVEMPYFTKWTEDLIEDILNIKIKQGLNVILAHVNRYLKEGFKKYCDILKNNGIIFQWNGEAFLLDDKKESLKFYEKGYVDLLGSDMHSLQNRPQNLNEVKDILLQDDLAMFNRILNISSSIYSKAGN